MMYHLGTDQPVPHIPWSKDAPALCSEPVAEYASAVLQHFSRPIVTYIGSSQGCGCGFRCYDSEEDGQEDHEALVRFIRDYASGKSVELYVCWDGDYDDSANTNEVIALQNVMEKDFHFKERGFYTIQR